MKYDFNVVISRGPLGAPSILTFGGNRETFDFSRGAESTTVRLARLH